ncbi:MULTISPECIES: META domain-containing protein [unclassified Pseudoalteromonas]|uniref:META domain-containing protein n=1 Tax=unclassified Pseudoalteromonas TaxID=194690 RepID=UPI0005A5F9E1|nr:MULTISPECIES: META domain-containing protein [unclassified Pseudoalteromonas]
MKSIYKYHGYFLAIICFLFIAGCHTIEQLQLDTEYKSNAPLTISPQILRFNQINTTEKFCTKGMEQQNSIAPMLEKVNSYKISGDSLFLYNKNNDVIAKLASRF